MPFGLKIARATFQRTMDSVLHGQEKHSSACNDDILFSMRWKDHLTCIEAVLQSLRINRLTVKLQKCVWGVRQLEYLGHVLGDGKIAIPEARVTAIRNFKRPVTKKRFEVSPGYNIILWKIYPLL